MIDTINPLKIIMRVGREDRAMLRSDLSARADAGTWMGGIAHCAAPSFPSSMYQPQSDKPTLLPPTGVPFGTIFGVC